MPLKTCLYIAFVLCLGIVFLGYGLTRSDTPHLLGFLCCLLLAVPASCLKIRLPGVTGTMSVLFLFLLAGVVELNLAEALVMGSICAAAQSFWLPRSRPRAVHVLFSMATIEISVTATYLAYRSIPGLPNPFRLLLAASVLFLTNTLPIAIVIALTEAKSIRQAWTTYYWYFPYYLAAASLVGTLHFSNHMLGWRAGILILPLAYVIYRSYHLYLNQLESERKHLDEERAHAAEVEHLHARTVEALAAARRASVRLDAVVRASPLAILTVDCEGNVTGWNAMAERIFGWSSDETRGRSLPVPAGRAEEVVEGVVARTLRGEAIDGEEMKQWRRDGTAFDAAIWSAPLHEAQQVSGTLITVADVSDRRRLEEQLRLSQKLEAIGQLAGGVAHDFNNLLTVINGYSSLLIDTVSGNSFAVSQAEEILSAGTRAAELVSQLLSFSRRQMIRPRSFELNEFVREIQRILDRVIGEHIELRFVLAEDAGWVHADLNQMEGVLLNLSTNARDAMPEGGVLTIATQSCDVVAGQPAPAPDLEPGAWVRLVVSDTGHGMDAETRQHLFEPFYTTKERTKGTGLGLSSVYGSVEQNRGRIAVSSELGRGTEFSIYLPRIEPPESPPAAEPVERSLLQGNETILLVEDESAVRQMLREALSKAGYRVWEAADGAEAITLWGPRIDQIDVVVTDLLMPVMNGLRLSEELRLLRPDLKVIFMSGHSRDVIKTQGGEQTQSDLLQKPFVPFVLVRKVRDVLDSRRGLQTPHR